MKRLRPRNPCLLAAFGLAAIYGICFMPLTETTMAGEKEARQVTLTDKDNGTKQVLPLNHLLVVHLEAQAGTGFSWVIAKNDKEQLPLLSSVLLDNPDKVPGGKAVQVFTFRASAAGASNLELHYQRPFDKGKTPAKTFKVTVTIEQKSKQVTLTDKDNNSKQKLAQGDLLVVHLETQPGTGFSWTIAKCDKEQLPLLSSVLLNNPAMLPGAKAAQVLTFRGAAVGGGELELHYKRPFEKDKEPAKTFKVTVAVAD